MSLANNRLRTVWPLHCHIVWHLSTGFSIIVLERPKDITEPNLSSVLSQTCQNWDAYTKTNVPDQIDSGLRM